MRGAGPLRDGLASTRYCACSRPAFLCACAGPRRAFAPAPRPEDKHGENVSRTCATCGESTRGPRATFRNGAWRHVGCVSVHDPRTVATATRTVLLRQPDGSDATRTLQARATGPGERPAPPKTDRPAFPSPPVRAPRPHRLGCERPLCVAAGRCG